MSAWSEVQTRRYELVKAALTGVANRIVVNSKGVPDKTMVQDLVAVAIAVADEAMAKLGEG